MTDTPLCRDCRWARPRSFWLWGWAYAACHHQESKLDAVTGEPNFCSNMRDPLYGACNTSGRLFSPRLAKPWWERLQCGIKRMNFIGGA